MAWQAFARHAESCPSCAPLLHRARRVAARPPYDLITGSCAAGRPLVEAWIYTCELTIQSSAAAQRLHLA